MFNNTDNFKYKYAPILSVSPAEMTALEELPGKDKDIILPIIPLKGWVGSQKLKNSIPRIEKAIGDRNWIADIDASFVRDYRKKQTTENYPREVFNEIEALLSPNDGYENWFQYLRGFPKAIPTIQLADPGQLNSQINKLNSLERGIVAIFTIGEIDSGRYLEVLQSISDLDIEDVFIVFDYEQVNNEILDVTAKISTEIQKTHRLLPTAIIAISGSSFPSSFSNEEFGENPTYERRLFNSVSRTCSGIRMIYSDRGGARAEKIGGGGGIPSPRIDYPLENDWRFIRKEFADSSAPEEGEKEELYTEVAKEIMEADYWKPNLAVWGTQVIELTSKGDMLGINSPMRATAVRINIHMHQQLYYGAPDELLDTDEDWED